MYYNTDRTPRLPDPSGLQSHSGEQGPKGDRGEQGRNELQGIHGEHIPPGPDKKLEVREFHGASVRYLRKEG